MHRIAKILILMASCIGLFTAQRTLYAQNVRGGVLLRGTVSSESDGLPIAGAYVVSSSGSYATTDIDGRYELETSAGDVITYQFLGFEDVSFTVPDNPGETLTNDVRLVSGREVLDDVVVVAYGVRKKGTIAGSVATVKSEILNDVPAASFDQALQGKAPGLSVISSSGEPSATASFRIRGINSINSGVSPLFILDGVQISASDFTSISPNDIESVSVLKDATSTSIYGARAANGVVVITTKRGRAGENGHVQVRMQLGFSDVAYGKWDLMNTGERILYEQEIGIDEGKNYDMLRGIDVDWRKAVFSQKAPVRNIEVVASGAKEHFNYYVSGGYYRQKGLVQDSDFSRYSVRANISADVAPWLTVSTNTMMTYEKSKTSISGEYSLQTPISAAMFMLPYWDPYKEDGSLASVNDGTWLGTGENPLEWMANNNLDNTKYKLFSNVSAAFKILPGLEFKTTGGVDFSYFPSESTSNPSYNPNNGVGYVAMATSSAMNLSWTNTLDYTFNIDNAHDFHFMVGHEMIDNSSMGYTFTTQGQVSDKLLNVSSATVTTGWGNSRSSSSYMSVFARGEYNYMGRYYLEASVRGDASSKFGRSNRWAPFWAVGFMWNLRNEAFMGGKASWLDDARISVNTGTTGNSSIPDYDHLALVSGGINYNDQAAIAPSSRGNESLTWEKVWTSNLSFQLGFFGRISFNVDLYNKLTSDMLMQVPIRFASGTAYKWDNIGKMVNRGAEFDLNVDVIRTKDFLWSVNANASYNRNIITELYNGKDEYELSNTGLKLVVGREYGEFFINRYAGVNPVNGDALWLDKDGNVTTEFREEDKVLVGKSRFAPWMGGFGTTFSWKGITLSAAFSWVEGRYMLNNDRFFQESNGIYQSYNQSRKLLYDRWKKPGDITDIPRHGVVAELDDRFLEDASFLRLKNLSLSYSFPENLLRKTRCIYSARIFAQAQNLFTFTSFQGMDPESESNIYQAQYPMSRQFTFGLEITF